MVGVSRNVLRSLEDLLKSGLKDLGEDSKKQLKKLENMLKRDSRNL